MQLSGKSSITISGIFEHNRKQIPLMCLRRNAPNNEKILFLSFVEEPLFLQIRDYTIRGICEAAQEHHLFAHISRLCVIIFGKVARAAGQRNCLIVRKV